VRREPKRSAGGFTGASRPKGSASLRSSPDGRPGLRAGEFLGVEATRMSIEAPEISEEEAGRTWGERFTEAAESARALLETRLQIFREEASAKAAFAAKGVVAIAIAATLGFGALLL